MKAAFSGFGPNFARRYAPTVTPITKPSQKPVVASIDAGHFKFRRFGGQWHFGAMKVA